MTNADISLILTCDVTLRYKSVGNVYLHKVALFAFLHTKYLQVRN